MSGSWTFLPDALGSTLALTDGSGSVSTQYTYEPFGATTITGAGSNNPAQFTGRENDGTGLYYYRARFYAPSIGRFAAEDPLRFHGSGTNLYAYVGNDPITNIDPGGCAFMNCPAAIANLARALANAKKDVKNADKGGKCLDRGHKKELEQRSRDLKDALDKVVKYCGKLAVAAVLIAEAVEVLEAIAAYLEIAALAL